MLGIVANIIAFVIFGFAGASKNHTVLIISAIVIFCLISFGFTYSQSMRAESDSCLYSILMWLNMIASGIMLFAICGMLLPVCGCA